MLAINPQYLRDENGKKSLVVLSAKEFEAILEELEDVEDVRLYDEAKKNDTGERIPMGEVFSRIEAERKAKG